METTNNNNALVSIIIPAYNTEQYIHRAIESSIRQTYKNIEIIIIDDGSTDGTLGVAQSYEPKDSRVKVIHQENKGVSSARNHGIREAKGEFITFLDSDDWFEDNAVEVLVEAQLKYPDAIISADRYWVNVNPDKKIFIRIEPEKKYADQFFTIEEAIMLIDQIRFRSTSAKIYRINRIKDNDIYFKENICYGEDMLFNFLYAHDFKKLYYMSKSVVDIALRPGSALRTNFNNKKIFINGKINDWIQIMIDCPGNTPEIKKALMHVHTYTFLIQELLPAIRGHASTYKMNQVIEKVRLYLPEYIKFNHDMPLTRKIYYYCILYLPLPIARTLCKIRVHMRDIISRIRRRFSKPKEEGEVIPYW
ncbi:MAG: glycosyltransferase family 2 protein [Synergistaceae bacterium]|nr:glycosyltransferase family 2 protein [Synergistaceae bacterium]